MLTVKPLEMRDAISARGLCGLINQLLFQDEIGCAEGLGRRNSSFSFVVNFFAWSEYFFCGIKKNGQSEIPIPNEKVNINNTTKAWKFCKLKTKSVSFFLNSDPQLGRSVQILFIWRPKKEIKWQKIKTKKII